MENTTPLSQPLCFTLMPFGTKTDGNQKEIDFNKVYDTLIRPAIVLAGLDPIRADGEQSAGFIHKPMYERLLFCDFAVADLSFANANVFYELGIRHAIRSFTTVCIFEVGTKLPFDVAPLRTFPYSYDKEVKNLSESVNSLYKLIRQNLDLSIQLEDSPIGQLVEGYVFPNLGPIREKAIAFNSWVTQTKATKHKISDIVDEWCAAAEEVKTAEKPTPDALTLRLNASIEAVLSIENGLGNLAFQDLEVTFVLITAYRTMGAWGRLVALIKRLPEAFVKGNDYLRQQLAQALSKSGNRKEAEEVLLALIAETGSDWETNGMLGSVYKSNMDAATNAIVKKGFHTKAVNAYVAGFEADPREYYPGVNALTLMFFSGDKDPRFEIMIPVVQYAVNRKLKMSSDYWGHATAVELAMMNFDMNEAMSHTGEALAAPSEGAWTHETTAKNLKRIYTKAIELKGENECAWMKDVISAFEIE